MHHTTKDGDEFDSQKLEEILGTPGDEDDINDDMKEEKLSG